MDIFIYKGTLFCTDCITAIKKQLDDDGHTPPNVEDVFSFNSTEYPKGPYNDIKSHMPQHCHECGEFLENELTEQGTAFLNELAGAIANRGTPPDDSELDLLNFYGLAHVLKRKEQSNGDLA